METMKAVICTKYGPPEVLVRTTVPKPTPKDNEILVRIRATTVHIGDTKIRGFNPGLGPVKDFFFKPLMRLILGFAGPRSKILGMELAGEVEGVGTKATTWKKGDLVFAATGMGFGAYAEYVCLAENGIIAIKPDNISFEEAAAIPNGGITALLILAKANIAAGTKVLVYGASGSVGTFAVQLARIYGADVTGVCGTANMEMVRSLGAGRVIDYTASDFTESGDAYDVIFDAVGKTSLSRVKRSLTKTGMYLNVLTASDAIRFKTRDLQTLKDYIEEGKLKAVIDRRYTLDQIVEAHAYVEKGHKKGNVAVTVE